MSDKCTQNTLNASQYLYLKKKKKKHYNSVRHVSTLNANQTTAFPPNNTCATYVLPTTLAAIQSIPSHRTCPFSFVRGKKILASRLLSLLNFRHNCDTSHAYVRAQGARHAST